jgi:glutathione peroxidase
MVAVFVVYGVMASLYDIGVRTMDGGSQPLEAYRGKTLLVVNVASRCGFTPQYTGLEALYRKYKDQGFVVLGFPCNQFGSQEPGTEAEIQQFCATTYDVTFPLFAKIDVNGPATHPLYELLKSAQPGVLGTEGIKWNFTKFLVNGRGEVVARYAPSDTPEKIEQAVIAAIGAPADR